MSNGLPVEPPQLEWYCGYVHGGHGDGLVAVSGDNDYEVYERDHGENCWFAYRNAADGGERLCGGSTLGACLAACETDARKARE